MQALCQDLSYGARGTNAMILPGIDVDIPVWQFDMGKAARA